ncbi:MAG: hypothetical protein II329_02830, partial [Clostridia bacterium]|nr:hypothetical protein [Clostridia bacterium]
LLPPWRSLIYALLSLSTEPESRSYPMHIGKYTSELAREVDFSSDEDRSARLRARILIRNRKPSHARSDVSARGSAKANVLLQVLVKDIS